MINETDQKRIKEKISEVEKNTSGEIVPYFVKASDTYTNALWKAAAIFGFGGVLINMLTLFISPDFYASPYLMPLSILLYGVAGIVAVLAFPTLKRMIIGHGYMSKRVERRAMTAFLSEEVFNTRERTGILIFVSEFEHIVEVIGDTGINKKVAQEDWREVVKAILEGIKNKKTADGIINGIELCGQLLQRANVKSTKPDNPNELDDSIRLG